MKTPRDLDSQIRTYLREDAVPGQSEVPDHVYGAIRDGIEHTRQRAVIGFMGVPDMNTFVRYGLATAAVVVVLLIGAQLGGTPTPGGPSETQSAAPSEAPSSVEPSRYALLPEGQFAWFEPAALPEPPNNAGPPITVTIPATDWRCPPSIYPACIIAKGDTIDTIRGQIAVSESDHRQIPLESALLVNSTTAGILVYEDPCQWEYDVPHPPATTAAAIADALAAQPSRDASDPVDVTVGGYPGKMITLHVPDDAVFADCFRGLYASYTLEGQDACCGAPWRWHQGPGQIDTLWIVEVDDAIVIIDAMYRADTPAASIEEMRAIAESAIFELP